MGKLDGKVAIVTGSDSGIGKATAEEFAREGADVAVTYLHDHEGAEQTRQNVEAAGRRAMEIRRLGTYLASEDADYVTGQTLVIDGGLPMNMGQGA